MMPTDPKKSVFLYGGCVIRDAFELISESVSLLDYVARQSLISSTNKRIDETVDINMMSKFQKRMVIGDLESDLYTKLTRAASTVDLLVIDFQVERLGVQRLPDGSFATRSWELWDSKFLSRYRALPEPVLLGSYLHTKYYEVAAKRFAQKIRRLGLFEKTLIVDAPWAEVYNTGEKIADYKSTPISLWNSNFKSLSMTLRNEGFTVRAMPTELATADRDHKWGPSPFHFSNDATHWIAEEIAAHLK